MKVHFRVVACLGSVGLVLALAPAVSAQDSTNTSPRNIRHLGGSTAFYRPSLTTSATLNRMGRNPVAEANIRTVISQAGIPELADRVVSALTSSAPSVRGGNCSDATPADGVLIECEVRQGETLLWMAYKPGGRKQPAIMKDLRWAARQPFQAFLFRVTTADRSYTFLVPKACGNLSLMSVRGIPAVAAVAAAPPSALPPPPDPAVVAQVPAAPPAAEKIAQTPAPPPPPAPDAAKSLPFFFDLLGGKDRRVREIGDRTTVDGSRIFPNAGSTNTDFAQCSPLLGIKFGLAKRFANDWELAGAAGIAFSLVQADDKVREHEVLADVEVNKYVGSGAFAGTGLSFWDITHGDTFTPAWLVHVGLPIGTHPRHPIYLLMEGRAFLDHADDPRNNYQFWGGVRVHL